MLAIAIAVVLLLVVLNGLFSMTELAVVSSRKSRLQSRAERGARGARAALNLAEEPIPDGSLAMDDGAIAIELGPWELGTIGIGLAR